MHTTTQQQACFEAAGLWCTCQMNSLPTASCYSSPLRLPTSGLWHPWSLRHQRPPPGQLAGPWQPPPAPAAAEACARLPGRPAPVALRLSAAQPGCQPAARRELQGCWSQARARRCAAARTGRILVVGRGLPPSWSLLSLRGRPGCLEAVCGALQRCSCFEQTTGTGATAWGSASCSDWQSMSGCIR